MNSSNPQIEHLKRMLGLEEKRAALLQQARVLESQLDSLKRQLVGGAPASAAKASVQTAPKRRGRPPKSASAPAPKAAKVPAVKAAKAGKPSSNARGQLQARIIAALKAAGSTGNNIKGLSAKFNMPYRNVQVWFATTGKKNKAIKKIGPATYRFVG